MSFTNKVTNQVMHNNLRYTISRKWGVRRDIKRRELFAQSEAERQAYLFIARNTTLPAQIRYKAQLSLNALTDTHASSTEISNRCVETGRGRGVLGRYGLCRIAFRLRALSGDLPGVTKATW
ncbi:hypothetical protein BD324DRAFT_615463 [Kockovaella imperatae]|uniref:Ribosomal protein S14 n=1 Tax=Kockovaella imperatae TaxID=4999 RepID=A0A1Y1UQZ4_9TREE|nr:hypothetical protein BD324DRAFT_615463 [Kockovaella imperatae]ORX39904.1 hypothetical protein BD324DRAFT_615463 [Kockovaella imperatae]